MCVKITDLFLGIKRIALILLSLHIMLTYMNSIIRCIFALLLTFFHTGLYAQSVGDDDSFELTVQGGHYVFSANINGRTNSTLLLESGIPAMLADSSFVFGGGLLSDLELIPSDGEKINLGGRPYRITHKAVGTVRISDHTSYCGEVFILSGYAQDYEIAVPIQHLQNEAGHHIVRLNLENGTLEVLNRSTLRELKGSYSTTPLNSKAYLGMPAVKTTLEVVDGDNVRKLKGNFNIDFGNPELVFLMHQHADVQRFLSENPDLELREGRNPRGEVVAQFIIAERCCICNTDFNGAVIAITKALPRFTTTGLVGLKYFKSIDAIFDFDRNRLHTSRP